MEERKKTVVYSAGIVGGGKGGLQIAKIFSRSNLVKIKWVCDRNSEAPAIIWAKNNGIKYYLELNDAFNETVDAVFEATGVSKIRDLIKEEIEKRELTDKIMFLDGKLSKFLFDISADPAIKSVTDNEKLEMNYCTFVVGGAKLAIPMFEISEVVNMNKPCLVPNSSVEHLGIINIRDECIPVIDLGAKLKIKNSAHNENSKSNLMKPVLIIRYPGNKTIGYLVDDVLGVTPILPESIDKSHGNGKSIFGGVNIGNDIFLILKTDRLL